MSDASQRVTCPGCGKGYRWQSTLAGKKVPCKQCGETFTVPNAPGTGLADHQAPVTEDGTYELDINEPASQTTHKTAPHNGKCPSCNSPIRAAAVLCMNCGFNVAEGKKLKTAVAETPAEAEEIEKPDRHIRRLERDMATAADTHQQYLWQEYRLPIILLCVGLALSLINAFALTPQMNNILVSKGYTALTNAQAIVSYFLSFAITLVMMLPLLLGGIFFMAAVLGSAFGNLFTAILKLLALTIFVVSLDHLVDLLLDLVTGGFGFIGWSVRLSVVLAAFYPICIKLFDMESHEIIIMFLLYVIGPIAIGMLATIIVFNMM